MEHNWRRNHQLGANRNHKIDPQEKSELMMTQAVTVIAEEVAGLANPLTETGRGVPAMEVSAGFGGRMGFALAVEERRLHEELGALCHPNSPWPWD
jgi:hypothetical protein